MIVRLGSRGEPVADLQQRLTALGFDIPHDERGSFALRTESAVRGFQAIRGIRVDGVCGPETWSALVDSGFHLGDRLLCARRPMLRGDDVGELQRRLNALGFDAGKEDAIFGPDTERALVEFQRNAAITTDGICGRETIATLDRLGTRADGAVATVRERDALRDARNVAGHRVYVTAAPGLEALAGGLVRGLRAAGADAVLDLSAAEESSIAAAANEYAADLFLGVRTRSKADEEPNAGTTCRCCYYASGTFRSEAGFAIATAMADGLAGALGSPGAACGRAYTVLRETRMTAVVCEPVVEGDESALRALESGAPRAADAAVAAIRRVLEQPQGDAALRLTRSDRLGAGGRTLGHESVDALEVLEGRELDDDLASRRAHADADPRRQVVSEELLELEQSGRTQPLGLGAVTRRAVGVRGTLPLPDRLLDRAHREVVGHHPLRELLLEGAIRRPQERRGRGPC